MMHKVSSLTLRFWKEKKEPSPICAHLLAIPTKYFGREELLTHFHMALILACVALRGSASGHFVQPEDLLLILVHAQLHMTFAEGLQTLIRSGLRVCF